MVSYKDSFTIGLISFLGFLLYLCPVLAKPQIKPSSVTLPNREQLLKCSGLSKEEIKLKPPFKNSFIPKDTEEYENRIQAGYRCGGDAVPINLTALVPQAHSLNNITLAKYPLFFVYLPDANFQGLQGKFILIDQELGEEIYTKKVSLKNRDSIVSINIADTPSLPPLKVNKLYYWAFSISIAEEGKDSASDFTPHDVGGWIIRVEPNSNLKQQLKKASPQELPAIYAANGIWYDAIASLAKLRCLYPSDPTWVDKWRLLLQQVNLIEDARNTWPPDNKADISQKPLAQCSSTASLLNSNRSESLSAHSKSRYLSQ